MNRGKSAGYYVSDGLENTGVESEEPGADMTDATMPEMLDIDLQRHWIIYLNQCNRYKKYI